MKFKMKYAPICLFTYNRLEEMKKTIAALQNNYLAAESELFIFSDGWKNESMKGQVIQVREYLRTIKGFKNIFITESSVNKGLAKSIIEGVSEVISKNESIIVLEDDLVTSPNFLTFMNDGLNFYKDNLSVFSVSGYTMNLPALKMENKDYYLGVRASSWGWGTWRRSWIDIDWSISDYKEFSNSKKLISEFRIGGSDMPRMLANQMNKKIDSWAIRWCYNQFKRKQYTIYPRVSKVESIGFGDAATHTKQTKRFDTVLDTSNQISFKFDEKIIVNKKLIKEFKNRFSVYNRLLDKFL